MKQGFKAQHSRMELLLRAPMTVTLRVLKSGAVAVAATAAALVRRVVRSLNETILCVCVVVVVVLSGRSVMKVSEGRKKDNLGGLRSIYLAELCTKS